MNVDDNWWFSDGVALSLSPPHLLFICIQMMARSTCNSRSGECWTENNKMAIGDNDCYVLWNSTINRHSECQICICIHLVKQFQLIFSHSFYWSTATNHFSLWYNVCHCWWWRCVHCAVAVSLRIRLIRNSLLFFWPSLEYGTVVWFITFV